MDEYERAVANKLHVLFPGERGDVSTVSYQNIIARVLVNLFKGIWVGAGFYFARFLLMSGRLFSWTGLGMLKPPESKEK